MVETRYRRIGHGSWFDWALFYPILSETFEARQLRAILDSITEYSDPNVDGHVPS